MFLHLNLVQAMLWMCPPLVMIAFHKHKIRLSTELKHPKNYQTVILYSLQAGKDRVAIMVSIKRKQSYPLGDGTSFSERACTSSGKVGKTAKSYYQLVEIGVMQYTKLSFLCNNPVTVQYIVLRHQPGFINHKAQVCTKPNPTKSHYNIACINPTYVWLEQNRCDCTCYELWNAVYPQF